MKNSKTKVTILLENSWGVVVLRHGYLHETRFEKVNGSFYNQKLVAIYTPKGKRKKVGFRFEKAVIAKGWQGADGPVGESIETTDFFSDVRFESCEAQLKDIIVHSEKDAPKPVIIKI